MGEGDAFVDELGSKDRELGLSGDMGVTSGSADVGRSARKRRGE